MRGRWMMAMSLAPLLMATTCLRGILVQVEPAPTTDEAPAFALWDYNDDEPAAAFDPHSRTFVLFRTGVPLAPPRVPCAVRGTARGSRETREDCHA